MADKPTKILHIDDDEANRYAVSRSLRRAGFDVVEGATGQAALDLAREGPDLIILDVQLPDMNGFEVCRRIKLDPATADVPVLHLSASLTRGADKATGLDGGADAYLVRPVEPVELIATVNALLRQKQAEDALRRANAELAEANASLAAANASLREGEARFRFLSEMGEATRDLTDPEAVMAAVARRLGEHIAASRCAYADVEPDADHFTIRHDYTAAGVASTAGQYRLDLFGSRAAADMRGGRTLVVRDVDRELAPDDGADTFNAIGIKAVVCCPLVKGGSPGRGGRLVAMMAVHQAAPRDWTAAEVRLVEEVVERSWAHVERARSRRALGESEARFERLVREVKDYAILTTDAAGRVTSFNPGSEAIFGYAEQDMLGRPLDVLFTEEDRAAGVPDQERRAAAEHGQVPDVRWHRRRDGSRFFVNGVCTAMYDEFGHVSGFAKVGRDETERQLAEEANARLAAMVGASQDAIFMMDLDGVIRSWNAAAERIFGYAPAEVIGRHVRLLVPPDRSGEPAALFTRVRRGEAVEDLETVRVCKDNRPIYVSLSLSPVRDRNGNVTTVAATLRDIGERRRAEAALRASEERYRTLFDTISDGFCIVQVLFGPDGEPADYRFLEANPAFALHTGLSGATGRTALELVPDLDRWWVRTYGRVATTGEPARFENHAPAMGGRWFDVYAFRFGDPASRQVAIFFKDVTAAKQAEADLRASEERYRTLFDSMDEGFCEIEVLFDSTGRPTDYRFVAVNPAFAKHTGLSDALGRTIRELVPGHEGHWFETYGKVATTGEPTRFVDEAAALGRWYDVYAFRVGDPVARRVAVLFNDVTAQRRAAETLRQSEQRLRLAVAIAAIGTFDIDLATGAVEVNDVGRAIYGWPPGEPLTFAKVQTHFHPADRDAVMAAVGAALAPGGPGEFEVEQRIVRTDKAERWIRVRGQATFAGDGPDRQAVRLIGTYLDVTDERRASDALRESEQRLRLAQRAGRVGAFEWLIAEERNVWSPELEALYGLAPGTFGGTFGAWRERVEPADADAVAAGMEACIRDRRADYAYEFRAILPDGARRWLAGQATFEYDAAGRPVRMIGVNVDIDARKRAEETLAAAYAATRQSEARFRQLADAMPQIVWAARPDGQLDYYNRRWFEYVGLPEQAAADDVRWDRYVHPDDLPRVAEAWGAAVAGGHPYIIEFRVRGADKAYRWFLVRALPIRAAGGPVVRWFGTCTDIHDQRQLLEQNQRLLESERQLLGSERAARAAAEDANRLKDEFLATLSHELRTPLNAILGWATVLARARGGGDDPDLTEGLDAINRNARAQAQLIEDLLDVSRIISGKLRLDVQRVELAPVVESAIASVLPAARNKGVRVQKVLDPAAATVWGDPGRLQQVVWNLLSNAVKFTPKDGRVQVAVSRVNSHVDVVVSDTGKGIGAEFLPYVFERFRQQDATTTRRYGGLGLGLAIVKHLVELHGGTVHAASGGEGRGSTFTVRLPLTVLDHPAVPGDAVHPRAGPVAAARPAGDGNGCAEPSLGGLRVLVVEDEPDARALLRRFLEECQVRVTVAATVREALAAVAAGPPFDVIVSDIGMPDQDGYELIRQVRRLPPEAGGRTPAIALTAFARTEDRRRALLAGFQIHVPKPVDPHELLAVVAGVAGRTG